MIKRNSASLLAHLKQERARIHQLAMQFQAQDKALDDAKQVIQRLTAQNKQLKQNNLFLEEENKGLRILCAELEEALILTRKNSEIIKSNYQNQNLNVGQIPLRQSFTDDQKVIVFPTFSRNQTKQFQFHKTSIPSIITVSKEDEQNDRMQYFQKVRNKLVNFQEEESKQFQQIFSSFEKAITNAKQVRMRFEKHSPTQS